jgi:DNA-directed RNA polymerase beta' subunit
LVVSDEGNIHSLSNLQANAEAAALMNVKGCIMNAQTNRPIMGAVYDTLTGAYLLTQPNVRVDRDDYDDCLMLITATDSIPTLDERLQEYDVPRLSGRALFSALLPPDFTYDLGDVMIRNGILLQGVITKAHIGTSHNSIVQRLWRGYDVDRTVDFLTDLPFVVNRWLASYGFSVGLKDCLPTDPNHARLIREEFIKAQMGVAAMGAPPEDPLERERYERQIVAIVNTAKDFGARIATQSLTPDNALRVMAKSGAKGAEFNIAQITGIVGQQFLRGERLKATLTQGSRCLPYFEPNDLSIEAHGFCEHSFMRGLSPAELFFHQAGTREGLMDTAIKTSETGSMHHRIVKALEDIQVAYDGSVRNANGTIFQYVYGEDGFDAAELQMVKTKTGETASFIDINESVTRINTRYGY